jgi:hypothetical protein
MLPAGTLAAGGITTTLNGGITHDQTTVILTDAGDGTKFIQNDLVKIGDEVIKLGSKSTHTFSSCVRGEVGVGRTTPEVHYSAAVVTKVSDLTENGTFVVPKVVLGLNIAILFYAYAGVGSTSPADGAKIILSSALNFFNLPT